MTEIKTSNGSEPSKADILESVRLRIHAKAGPVAAAAFHAASVLKMDDPSWMDKIKPLRPKEISVIDMMSRSGLISEILDYLTAPRWKPGRDADVAEIGKPQTRRGFFLKSLDLAPMAIGSGAVGIISKTKSFASLTAAFGAGALFVQTPAIVAFAGGAGLALVIGGIGAGSSALFKGIAANALYPEHSSAALDQCIDLIAAEPRVWESHGVTVKGISEWLAKSCDTDEKAKALSRCSSKEILSMYSDWSLGDRVAVDAKWEELLNRKSLPDSMGWFVSKCVLVTALAVGRISTFVYGSFQRASRDAARFADPGRLGAVDDGEISPEWYSALSKSDISSKLRTENGSKI